MPARLPTAALLIAGAAALVAAHAACRDPRPTGIDLPPDLARPNDRVVGRVLAKQAAAAALLRGEMTLAEAAGRFEELNGEDALPTAGLREWYPDAGEDELACRQVLRFAARDLVTPPAGKAARLPILEAEFRARFPAAALPVGLPQ